MQYKTVVLEFLQEYHPPLHDRLRASRKLLRTMNAYAAELRRKHRAWTSALRPMRPESSPSQISGEALELALEDLDEALRQESSADASKPLSLDEAMAFVRRHTPPA